MYRQLGASATLDALLVALQQHGSGYGRLGQRKWDGDCYTGCEGLLTFYEASHIDPFAMRQDFFKREHPRDVARFGDFSTAFHQKPYMYLLGHNCTTMLNEMYLGDNVYVRRVSIDKVPVTFTFSLQRKHGRWGVEFLLAEDHDEALELKVL